MTQPAQGASAPSRSSLDKDTFLGSSSRSLKYQDPSKPVDSSQFMAQTAQFTQVETLQSMSKDTASSLALQQGMAASNLVGKTVSWVDGDGGVHSGRVSSAQFGGSAAGPVLSIGNQSVELSSVTKVASAG
ncbi:flagellar basal body rod modification protein FlgD [Angustibacter aerolatus]|uniref:Flagellar basal body rod modification protein FlgD n=1 Tax=Angustibacter aerolatus TaxID=1162965 RepID=A0ABQ6JNE8_9ACTN|nr:flagellar hook capping FlgD N-terminal domain-containing protein [Angustibacter aerolatus]GMA88908.1 flagellar basal body rod modification protein FlgD [Angustibacter aerolatus]